MRRSIGGKSFTSGRVDDRRDLFVFIAPFWAHYRGALIAEMQDNESFSFEWWGDSHNFVRDGIPSANLGPTSNFTLKPCIALPRGLMWQRGVVSGVLRSSATGVVFSGDARHLATWLGAVMARIRRKRVFFWTHGWRNRDSSTSKRIARMSFYKLAHDLLIYGPDGVRVGELEGYPPERMHVIYNSLGAPITAPAARVRDRSISQEWVIVSRLTGGRGVDEAIRAVTKFSRGGHALHLTLVGDGPDRRALEELAASLNAPVTFMGAQYDVDVVARILEDADMTLCPSHAGLSAIHALSSGCPVATHDSAAHQMPEHVSVIDGVTGVRFPYNDFNEMVRASWKFVAHRTQKEVVEACHAEVRARWTPEAQAARIRLALQATQKVVGTAGRRGPRGGGGRVD